MAERFGDIPHINNLYGVNSRTYDMERIRDTHGGEDYSPEWVINRTQIKMCQVPWDDEYRNVIDWQHFDKVSYFENIEGRTFDLETPWNLKKLEVFKPSLNGYVGECDVPLTFEECLLYNYLHVKQYRQHVAKGEIIEDFYFFISSFDKIAPNTTRLNIHNDIWTQYLSHFENRYMQLTRGHYLHYLSPVQDFFDNPLDCEVDLREPEPDLPSVKRYNPYEKFTQLDDELCAVIVSTCSLRSEKLINAGEKFWEKFDIYSTNVLEKGRFSSNFETFQPLNNGSTIYRRSRGSDPIGSYWNDSPQPSVEYSEIFHNSPVQQLYCYKTQPENVAKVLDFLNTYAAYAISHIQAIYILPARLVRNSQSCYLAGNIDASEIEPGVSLDEIEKISLTPEDFGYDNINFSKLFTSQFATVRITTLGGDSVDLAFEDFSGDVSIYGRASTVFPFLKLEAFVAGVGSDIHHTYNFKSFLGAKSHVFGGAFEDTRVDFDVPIYGVYVSGDVKNALDFVNNITEREKIARNNRTKVLSAETSRYNSYNSALATESQTIFNANVAKFTGDNSNAASKTTSDRSATTAKANADRSANTTQSNALQQNATQNSTTLKDIDTMDTIANWNFDFNYEQQQRNIDNANYVATVLDRYYHVKPISQNLDWINERQPWKYGLATASIAASGGISLGWEGIQAARKSRTSSNEQTTKNEPQDGEKPVQTQTANGNGSNIGGGSAGFGGPTSPNIAVNAAQLVAQIAIGNTQLNRMIAWEQEEKRFAREFEREQIDKYAENEKSFNEQQNTFLRDKARQANTHDINNKNDHENKRFATENNVINATHSTAITNNAATYDTSLSNNSTIYDTTATNVQRTRDAGETDAHHSKAVSLANADNGYNLTLDTLDNERIITTREQESGIHSAQLEALSTQGDFTGDNFNIVDNGYCGISVQIHTIGKAEARQVAETFNRYGYRCAPGCVVSNLTRYTLFDHFTYWEAKETYGVIDGNETAAEFMRTIFNKGVTVWTSPQVIYDYSRNERIANAI